MSAYIDFISTYFNLFSILGTGLLYAVLGFILSLVLMLCFKRKILVKRNNVALKSLAYSYFFVIPIATLILCFVFGVARGTRNELIDKLPVYQGLINQQVNYYFALDMVEHPNMDITFDARLESMMPELYQQITDGVLTEDQKDNVFSQFVVGALKSPMGAEYLKDQVKSQIATAAFIDKDLVDELFTLTPRELVSGHGINKILTYYIDSFYSKGRMIIFLIWFLVYLAPAVEIFMAHRRLKTTTAQDDSFQIDNECLLESNSSLK